MNSGGETTRGRMGDTMFFVAGGTLRSDSRSYVERRADAELLEGLLRGEFCYVLTSRQMGKSSLMARTAQRLRERGVGVIALDLTAIGQNLTPEQWYDGLLLRMGRQTGLEEELEAYWSRNARYSPVQRLFLAVRDVILVRRPGAWVVFVDELDMVRSLPFKTDEFFAAIRECYTRRIDDSELARLSFCLLGVATPTQLIRDVNTTPFNIGRRIELTDFSLEEAAPLAWGFEAAAVGAAPAVEIGRRYLERVLYWTGGHPYLTQRLCRTLLEKARGAAKPGGGGEAAVAAAADDADTPERRVDRACADLFLSARARERDDNLSFVRERLLRCECDLGELLELYQRVRDGVEVEDDETDEAVNHLRLAGIVRLSPHGLLAVRNRIYHEVFDDRWVAANRPQQPPAYAPGRPPVLVPAGPAPTPTRARGDSEGVGTAVPGAERRRRLPAWVTRRRVAFAAVLLVVWLIFRGDDPAPRRSGTPPPPPPPGLEAVEDTPPPVPSGAGADALAEVAREVQRIEPLLRGLKIELSTNGLSIGVGDAAGASKLVHRSREAAARGSENDLQRALELAEEAVELSPRLASARLAWAEAAHDLWAGGYEGGAEGLAIAREQAQRALQADPREVGALRLLSRLARYAGEWSRAEELARAGTLIAPSNALCHAELARLASLQLRHAEAIEASAVALACDAQSAEVREVRGRVLATAGRGAEALAQADVLAQVDLARARLLRATVSVRQGRALEAWEELARVERRDDDSGYWRDVVVFGAHAGRFEEARSALAQLRRLEARGRRVASRLAEACAALGQREEAMRWLARAVTDRDPELGQYRWLAGYDFLVTEPGFGEAMAPVRLPAAPQHPLRNAEAERLYKQGRFLWAKRTPGALSNAMENFRRATELDPGCGPAWAALAQCLVVMRPGDPETERLALKAVELEPNLASAYAVLGSVASMSWNWQEAQRRFVEAFRIDPADVVARHWYGVLLVRARSDPRAGYEQFLEAARLDPTSAQIQSAVGVCLRYLGRFEESRAVFEGALRLEPEHPTARLGLAEVLLLTGHTSRSLALIEQALESKGREPSLVAWYGMCLGLAGRTNEAAGLLRELEKRSDGDSEHDFWKAALCAALGRTDEMFRLLEIEMGRRSNQLPMIRYESVFDRYREDPRFQDLMRRMRIPALDPPGGVG